MEENPLHNRGADSNASLVLALCAISASTMIVEIVLVKFVAFKVCHHFINVIISTVVLSFAGAGTYLYMRGGGANNLGGSWHLAAREAALFAISLMLLVLVFCWLPLDPYNAHLTPLLRFASLPIYFMLFAFPFFFGGLCISRVLAESSLRPSRVLLFDLGSAAIAAASAPVMLDLLGGYGVIGLAASLGFIAYFLFQKASGKPFTRSTGIWCAGFLSALSLLLVYPAWAHDRYGIDIRTGKCEGLQSTIVREFSGFRNTYWNAIARIDVSNTGWSNDPAYLYGLEPHTEKREGRVITVDNGAQTRQFANRGKLSDQKFLGEIILALPYVIRPDAKDALIIGGGGGLDVTVAKFFGIPNVFVLEMNPMTYRHVLLGQDDPERALYQTWLESDDKTKVSVLNKEARSFCSGAQANSFDTIHSTAVDTFTAIASGALTCSDNYLYTYDAIKSYAHLLKPSGLLSLTYSREPRALALKLFLASLNYLEDSGATEPWRNVVVVGTDKDDVVMKLAPFPESELTRLRRWCATTGATLIFDPERRGSDTPGLRPEERIFAKLAFADHNERQKIINSYPENITPATDDKPYFYQIDKSESWLFSSPSSYTPAIAVILTAVFASLLIVLPLCKAGFKSFSLKLLPYAIFFAMCGFAFLFFEVAIVQIFSVFVGGPAYALAVVLVSVLAGYSIGCSIVLKLPLRSTTFIGIGVSLFAANISASLFLPPAINSLLAWSSPARITFCAIVTLIMSALSGLPVPLSMEYSKRSSGFETAWFWGITCAFNALGAACFPLISMQVGTRATLIIVAVIYVLANILFATLCLTKTKSP